jgi:hypothetical protein
MKIAIADLLIILLASGLFWLMLVELFTVFTREGVRRPGILKPMYIRWKDVTTVKGCNPQEGSIVLEIRSHTKTLRINLLYYKNQEELFSIIKEQVPPSVTWC